MVECNSRAGKVERSIIEILEASEGGEIYQSDLVRQSGFSKSRISEVLASLEERGLLSKTSIGKNLKILPAGTFRVRERNRGSSSMSNAKKNSNRSLRLGMIRASEYPFVLPFEKALREKMGITLHFVLYNNGVDLSRDLSRFQLDLGIAPVLTHFMFFSMGSPIKMIAPAGSGGAAILVNRSGRSARENFGVGTTKLSTMELMLRSSINAGDLPKSSSINYYGNPQRMMDAAISGEVDATCLWEPYSSLLLRKRGFKKLLSYEDSNEDHACCAVAAGNHLNPYIVHRIAKIFAESLDAYRKNPEQYLASYSIFMGFDQKLMKMASKEYAYPSELDPHKLGRQFERAGIKIPLPSSVKEAVLVSN